MARYPARIASGEEGLVLVTFPDVPEAVVCAGSEEEALARAPEVLALVLHGYRTEHRPMPIPSRIRGAPLVEAYRAAPAVPAL